MTKVQLSVIQFTTQNFDKDLVIAVSLAVGAV